MAEQDDWYTPPEPAAGKADWYRPKGPPPSGAEIAADVGKQALSGIATGLEKVPETAAGLFSLAGRGVDYLFGTGNPQLEAERAQLRDVIEQNRGGGIAQYLPEPQTPYGQSARNIADVAASTALAGPMRGALAAGVGSEALGKAAETFAPSLEPYARAVGAVAGGATGALAAERKAADAARAQLLNEEAPWGTKALYKIFDDAAENVGVDWKLAARIKNQMRVELQGVKQDTSLAEKLIDKFAPKSVKDLRTFRSDTRKTLYDKGEGQSAQALTKALDMGIEEVMPMGPGRVGVDMLQSADRQFALTKLAQNLAGRITTAEAGTAATHSGLNLDNKVRQALQSFKNDERAWHSLTPQEQVQIESIIRGSRAINATRWMANFFGGGGGLGAGFVSLVGHQVVPGWGLATPAA